MKQAPQTNIVQPIASRRRATAEARKASQQKKLVIAGVLFLVMAILWLRFFIIKDGPKAAEAASDANLLAAAAQPVQEVIYIDLPVIAGRQDILANDLFDAKNFKGFRKIGETAYDSELGTTDTNEISEDLAAALAEMELLAIVKDKKPQAFIGDNLVEPGQSFKFAFRDRIYNFKVINILEDRVELKCNGTIVTKKIPDPLLKTE